MARARWHDRDQRGSWSIKAVLPTVAPAPAYGDPELGEGMAAQLAYLRAIDPAAGPGDRASIAPALKALCCRDTEAMITLAKHLVAAEAKRPGPSTAAASALVPLPI